MNLTLRSIAVLALTLLIFAIFAAPTYAADSPGSPVCFGLSFLNSIAGDRSKIIQLSIVFVLIGVALLFKK